MQVPTGKREQNRQRRRNEIVEVARRAFLDHGYSATSMSAIADELGGSKATLWSHFASKEELFIAVVDTQAALFACATEEALGRGIYSTARLRRYCLRFLTMLMQPDSIALFRVILGDGGRFPEINNIFHVRGPVRAIAFLTEFLATGFPRDEAERLATLIFAAMSGWRTHVLTRPEPLETSELENFVDDFIAHLRLGEYEDGPDPQHS